MPTSSTPDAPAVPAEVAEDAPWADPRLPMGWQQLPVRGATLAATCVFLGTFCALLLALLVVRLSVHEPLPWLRATLISMAMAIIGGALAYRRHRCTRWRLDEHGFSLIQGRLWQSETRIPISRVQHLDVRRGPMERAARLSTLVVHTAGTRLSAVSVSGLDQDDAEHLRDRLAHQLDRHDDAL